MQQLHKFITWRWCVA